MITRDKSGLTLSNALTQQARVDGMKDEVGSLNFSSCTVTVFPLIAAARVEEDAGADNAREDEATDDAREDEAVDDPREDETVDVAREG